MADLFINPITHDLDLTNNMFSLSFVGGESVTQRLVITLNTFKGEWDFNIGYGVPYLKNENNPIQLLGKSSKDLLDLEIKQAIINTRGVTSLDTFNSVHDLAQRTVDLDFTVTSEDGDVVSVITTI